MSQSPPAQELEPMWRRMAWWLLLGVMHLLATVMYAGIGGAITAAAIIAATLPLDFVLVRLGVVPNDATYPDWWRTILISLVIAGGAMGVGYLESSSDQSSEKAEAEKMRRIRGNIRQRLYPISDWSMTVERSLTEHELALLQKTLAEGRPPHQTTESVRPWDELLKEPLDELRELVKELDRAIVKETSNDE